MARNARAHIEDLVTADPEIDAEYEALQLRRAIVGQLRALRERKRWTQQQLADAVGVPRSAIARLESAGHSPRLETLHAVARVLGYDVDVRLKRSSPPSSRPSAILARGPRRGSAPRGRRLSRSCSRWFLTTR